MIAVAIIVALVVLLFFGLVSHMIWAVRFRRIETKLDALRRASTELKASPGHEDASSDLTPFSPSPGAWPH
jgi:hypothetical protein